MNRLNVLEEIVCFTVLVQSGMKLDWSIPFLIAGTVSILNFPDLFPPEDSRYFETSRQRASNGYCVCSLITSILHAAMIRSESDPTNGTRMLSVHMGFIYSSVVSFAATQVLYSALFSGLYIPFAISITLMVLPCVISAQVFGIMEVFDFDSSIEVAFLGLVTLLMVALIQVSLKQSFTPGESFLVANLSISGLLAITEYKIEADYSIIFATYGLAAFIATVIIIFTGYVTRIERNSSPNLTVGDAQLSVTYHAVIVLSPLLATMIGSIMGLGLPIQLIIDRAVSSLDFGHFFLLIWGCGLVLICLKFATANQNMKKTEMTTEERKVFHFAAVLIYVPAMVLDLPSLGIISFALFWLFIWLSLYSSYQIYPYGGQLRRILMSITDYRDNGKLVLTPIYLVFGLSAPIWFDLMRFGEIKLSSFAGLASVGIGDSFASIVGKKYGRSRIFRDGKSVEGMLANFFSQLIFMSMVSLLIGQELSTNIIPALFLTAAAESTTDQIDNLILPLLQYSLISLIA